MNRRTFWLTAGMGLAAVTAGCLGDGGLGTPDDGTDDTDDESGSDDDDQQPIPEEPRIDEPPYPIEQPDPPEDDEDLEWNDDYLGEQMPTEPSLPFEALPVSRGLVDNPQLDALGREQYWIDTLETAGERDELIAVEETRDETRERLKSVDFDDEVLVVVESGFGSGSVSHRWGRVETDDEGIHLHGYYSDPYSQTDDIRSWLSLLVVDRPDEPLDLARCSLTVSENRRVHFNSTEGVVSVEGSD